VPLASAAANVHVSGNGKLLAVVAGLVVLGAVWIVYQLVSGSWTVWKLADGQDGALSTSKLQWFVWLAVILFSYTVLWVARVSAGHYVAISDIPTNVLAVLGLSTGSAVLAKGITSSQVANGHVVKPKPAAEAPDPPDPPEPGQDQAGQPAPAAPRGGALSDDDGVFDLGKVQMVAFTAIAVLIYLATVLHRLRTDPVNTGLPNIDSSLLVLMGISHGGYLGKKLVSAGVPVLHPPHRVSVRANAVVTLQGASLGAHEGGGELLMDGQPVAVGRWTTSSIRFTFPAHPAAGGNWHDGQLVQLQAVVNGQPSNTVKLRVATGH
jgi:hypothetical protein